MTEQNELMQELRQVRRSAFMTCAVVVLLTSGIAPALCWFFVPVTAGNPVSTLWQVGLRTYPLTLAVAFITFCRHARVLRTSQVLRGALVIMVGMSLSSVVQQWNTANVGGESIHLTQIAGDVAGTLSKLVGQLGRFFREYGAAYFFASIAIGIFCGKTVSRLFPHLTKGVDLAVDEVRDLGNIRGLGTTAAKRVASEIRRAA